jgi:hypothetical protein
MTHPARFLSNGVCRPVTALTSEANVFSSHGSAPALAADAKHDTVSFICMHILLPRESFRLRSINLMYWKLKWVGKMDGISRARSRRVVSCIRFHDAKVAQSAAESIANRLHRS